jgi:amino acid transporter
MEKNVENVFHELKDDLSTFAELKLELIKLNAYERISKLIAILSYGLLLFALLFITIQFALLTLGFALGKWLNSTIGGFGIVVAIYLIQVIVVILNKERIRRKVINIIISALNSNEHNKDATTDTEQGTHNPQ